MRCLPPWALAVLALSGVACKDPETVAEVKKIRTAADQIAQGKQYLEQGRPDLALPEFQQAAAGLPADPMPRLLAAQAAREMGNDALSILTLKEAVELSRGADPGLQKQLADALRQDGYVEQAVPILLPLLERNLLTDQETLQLAKMQAKIGDVDGAFGTLERIQKVRPDDLDAKLTEAELLLAAGEDALAQKILDRLAVEQPQLAGVRLLRARLLLNAGEAQKAADELSDIQGDAETLEVAELKAEILCALDRYEEADSALGHLLEERPRDADILSRLAEVKLNLGAVSTAEMLVEQALGAKPRSARALFMRGRIYEAQNVLDRAEEQYTLALKSDPSLAPALSRMWRIYKADGEAGNAMSALERLLFMKMATIEEKAALAELYADSKMQIPRARKLIAEAIKHDPKSAKLREIEKKLGKAPSGKKKPAGGIEVMSWGKRRR